MLKLRKAPWFLLTPLIPAACHDATGPCDLPFACEVPGIDLEISRFDIVADEHDSVTGYGVVGPDSIDIMVTVRNRGDSISRPTTLVIDYGIKPDSGIVDAVPDSLVVPPLRPGQTHTRALTFVTWESAQRPRWPAPWEDLAYFAARLSDLADADTTNNHLTSAKVHIRVPILELNIAIDDTALKVNRPFDLRLTINNLSRHGTLPAAAVGFWLLRMPSTAIGGPNGFGTHDMLALAPSGRYERDLVLSIPPTAAWNYSVGEYSLVVTVVPPGTPDSLLWRADRWLAADGPRVMVHPDYDACQPPLLRVDTAAVSPLTCTTPWATFYVFRFEPRTDREYSLEQQGPEPGATIYNLDGSQVLDVYPGWWLHFHTAKPYYVVDLVERNPPPSRTMTLRVRELTHTDDGGDDEQESDGLRLLRVHRSLGVRR